MRNAAHVVISAAHRRRTNPLHARAVVRHRVASRNGCRDRHPNPFRAQWCIVDRRLQQFPTVAATRFLVKASVFRASSRARPDQFSTSRAFCGETRMYRLRSKFIVRTPYAFGADGVMAPDRRDAPVRRRFRRRFIECP